jgi:hypothetical protein
MVVVFVLQGSVSVVMGNGTTVKLADGSAFMTAGCNVPPADVPRQVRLTPEHRERGRETERQREEQRCGSW